MQGTSMLAFQAWVAMMPSKLYMPALAYPARTRVQMQLYIYSYAKLFYTSLYLLDNCNTKCFQDKIHWKCANSRS